MRHRTPPWCPARRIGRIPYSAQGAPMAGALLVPASVAVVPPVPARPADEESVKRGIFRRRTSPRPEINTGKIAGNNPGSPKC